MGPHVEDLADAGGANNLPPRPPPPEIHLPHPVPEVIEPGGTGSDIDNEDQDQVDNVNEEVREVPTMANGGEVLVDMDVVVNDNVIDNIDGEQPLAIGLSGNTFVEPRFDTPGADIVTCHLVDDLNLMHLQINQFQRLAKPTWPRSPPTIPAQFFRDLNRRVRIRIKSSKSSLLTSLFTSCSMWSWTWEEWLSQLRF